MLGRFQIIVLAVLLSRGLLVVRADSPPFVTAARLGCDDPFQLDVTFDEPVDVTTALDPFNYTVFRDASDDAPRLFGGDVTEIPDRLYSFRVTLDQGTFVPDTRAMLRVENVTDLAGSLVDRQLKAITPCLGPLLSLERIGEHEFQITWTTNSNGFRLESSTSLPATAWQVVTNSVVQEGERFAVRLDALEMSRFYQLRKQ